MENFTALELKSVKAIPNRKHAPISIKNFSQLRLHFLIIKLYAGFIADQVKLFES